MTDIFAVSRHMHTTEVKLQWNMWLKLLSEMQAHRRTHTRGHILRWHSTYCSTLYTQISHQSCSHKAISHVPLNLSVYITVWIWIQPDETVGFLCSNLQQYISYYVLCIVRHNQPQPVLAVWEYTIYFTFRIANYFWTTLPPCITKSTQRDKLLNGHFGTSNPAC